MRFNFKEQELKPDYKSEEVLTLENIGLKYRTNFQREDLKNISYNFLLKRNQIKEEYWALKSITFQAYKGDIIGIIGSNGAGKTSLCKVIAGIIRQNEGNLNRSKGVTSFLSIGAGFNKDLTGEENIFLSGMMLGIEKNKLKEVKDEIIDFSGIGDFIKQPIKYYSNGMRARLGFSIAAMCEPDIMIIDEALSVGDHVFNEKAAKKIQQLVSKASLVMVVTHQVDFVTKYCTKALWLDQGSVRGMGSPHDIVQKYKDSIPANKNSKPPKILELIKTEPQQGSVEVISLDKVAVKFSLLNNNSNKKVFSAKKDFFPLKDISFKVKEGEIVGIIGVNGAGKSTLCRLISGILKPDEGRVSVDGNTSALLSLGTGFNMELSGKDNVYLNGMMLGIPKKEMEEVYDEIIDFSELGKAIDKPLKHYSSGMKARLGFSIAAMIKPDIFIIDEALNTGDISFYEKASRKIQELIISAKAVIIVTHSMSFVERICTRAIWLDKGKIVGDGSSEEIVKKYLNK